MKDSGIVVWGVDVVRQAVGGNSIEQLRMCVQELTRAGVALQFHQLRPQ